MSYIWVSEADSTMFLVAVVAAEPAWGSEAKTGQEIVAWDDGVSFAECTSGKDVLCQQAHR